MIRLNSTDNEIHANCRRTRALRAIPATDDNAAPFGARADIEKELSELRRSLRNRPRLRSRDDIRPA